VFTLRIPFYCVHNGWKDLKYVESVKLLSNPPCICPFELYSNVACSIHFSLNPFSLFFLFFFATCFCLVLESMVYVSSYSYSSMRFGFSSTSLSHPSKKYFKLGIKILSIYKSKNITLIFSFFKMYTQLS